MRREHTLKSGELPSGYLQLEYIESTGTQYINTGYYPNQNTYLELDFQPTLNDRGYNRLAYVRWTGSPDYMSFGIIDGSAWNYYITLQCGNYNYNYKDVGLNTSTWLIQRHIAVIDGVNCIGNIDNYNVTFQASTFQSSLAFYLFAFIDTSSISCGYMKLYSCILKENNVIVHNFTPALRTSDSKPGLWDSVTNTFYTNAGTGEFNYA